MALCRAPAALVGGALLLLCGRSPSLTAEPAGGHAASGAAPAVEGVAGLPPLEPAFTPTREEAETLRRGGAVARRLPGAVSYEVAVAGAIRVRAGLDRFARVARDIRQWKNGPAILQLGVFGTPPSPADVHALRLHPADFETLSQCARGNCSSKLAALAPEVFRSFDWSSPDARPRAEAAVRDGLLRYVDAYMRQGNAALMVYADDRRTNLRDELDGLIEGFPELRTSAPQLADALARFPAVSPAGTESYVYWARETFGFKPMLSAYHVMIHRPADRRDQVLVASKQFYASRYFDVSLTLVTATADPEASDGEACYVAHVARSRVDSLRGVLGRFKRWRVGGELEENMLKILRRYKAVLEADGPAEPARQAGREDPERIP